MRSVTKTNRGFKYKASGALFAVACLLAVSFPDQTSAQSGGELEAEIKAIENGLLPPTQIEGDEIVQYNMLDRVKQYNIPGLSIAIVIDGKIRWAKGYGITNSKTGKKVNIETVFQAASISKPVSALGTLKLVEEGKLDLDENVNTYLKDWKVTDNKFTKKEKVTLRRILSHNAGVSVHGFAGYPQSKSLPSTTEILEGKGQSPVIKVDAEPGTIYRYSGGGYTIMDKVIADVTGMPLEDYVNENILKAIGMTNSTFSKSLGEPYSNNAAAGFNRNGKMMDGLWHNYPMLAAASLWTTPTDLAKYCIEVQEIFDGKTDGVLSQKMVKEMLTDQVDGRGHGLGPVVGSKVPFSSFEHGGGNDGFRCNMRAFLKKKVAVIIMTNSDNGVGPINAEIERAISKYYKLEWNDQIVIKKLNDPPYLKDLKKSYNLDGVKWKFSYQDGVLKVDIPNDGNFAMVPLSDKEFDFPGWPGYQLKFYTDETDAIITKIEYIEPNQTLELEIN